MKIKEDLRKVTTTQTNLARALNLTQPRINQLIEEGVVIRDEQDPNGGVKVFLSLQNFFTAKAISTEDDEADFWQEKAKHERAKRELAELKLAERKGELYEAATVENVLVEILTDAKNKLLGLPTKIAPQLAGKSPAQIQDALSIEVEDLLKELVTNVQDARYQAVEAQDEDETLAQD